MNGRQRQGSDCDIMHPSMKGLVLLAPGKIRFYQDRPAAFVEDIIGVAPDACQAAILDDVAQSRMTSVRSGHGVGKSAAEAWLILWYLYTRPFPKVPCTAPTQHQLHDILWAEVAKWIRHSALLSSQLVWTRERVYLRGHPEEWFAVPRTATKPDALQGFHAGHVLYVIDEASGVEDRIFEPVLGALSGPGAKLLMCGNPTRLSGFFYESHHQHRGMYRTHHIDARTSGRVSADFVRSMADLYGEDSDVFRVRVAGEFPRAQADSFIALEWAVRAVATPGAPPLDPGQGVKPLDNPCFPPSAGEGTMRDMPALWAPARIDIGVDVARFGDDSSVLCLVLADRAHAVQQPPEVYHHNDTMVLTGHLVAMIRRWARRYPHAAIRVKIDCDGLGAGVYDRLREQREAIMEAVEGERAGAAGATGEAGAATPVFRLDLYECHFGGKGGVLETGDPVAYANTAGLMWGAVREALRVGRLTLCRDDRLIAQLTNRRYTISSQGTIALERKEDMKRRGLPSPDIADALALAMYEPRAFAFVVG